MRNLIVGVAALLLTGCDTVQDYLSNADKPTARIQGVQLHGLDLSSVTLRFDVEITNPYGVALPLVSMSYGLASSGVNFLTGSADAQGSVPARGAKVFPLDAKVTFAGLLQVLQSVRPGQVVPYEADLKLIVDASAIGQITLPLRKSGTLPIPQVPKVSLQSIRWQTLALDEATAVLSVDVENTNDFALGLQKLGYALRLGGTDVVKSSASPSQELKNRGDRTSVTIPITIKPLDFGLGVFNMLRGKSAGYSLGGDLEVSTPFGPLLLPYRATGRVPFSR